MTEKKDGDVFVEVLFCYITVLGGGISLPTHIQKTSYFFRNVGLCWEQMKTHDKNNFENRKISLIS